MSLRHLRTSFPCTHRICYILTIVAAFSTTAFHYAIAEGTEVKTNGEHEPEADVVPVERTGWEV